MIELFVVVAWLLGLVVVASGWGALSLRLAGVDREAPFGFFEQALVGAFVMTLVATALNFVLPLNGVVTGLVALGGLVAAGLTLRRSGPVGDGRRVWRIAVLVVLAFGFVAGGIARGSEYDTGLYHLQTVLWNHETALPFGLANVHGRLAYNSAWLTFASVLWLPVLELRGPFLANMLLSTVVLGALVEQVREAPRGAATFSALFVGLLLLPPGGFFAWQVGAPATDSPSILLSLFAFSQSLVLSRAEGAAKGRAFVLLATSAVLAVGTKLLGAPILLLVLLPWLLDRSRLAGVGRPLRRWGRIIGVFALLHVARSWVLSGCLAYPLAVTCVPSLPWAVSVEAAAAEAQVNRDWAKWPWGPPEGLVDWAWLPQWIEARAAEPVLQVALGLSVLGLVLVLVGLLRRERTEGRRGLSLFVPQLGVGVVGVVTWFFAAPDPRFGFGFLLAVPLLLVAMGLDGLPRVVWARRAAVGFVSLSLLVLVGHGFLATAEVRQYGFIAWPDVKRADVQVQATRAGVAVWRVTGGDDRCWDAPRPCTPLFNDDLVEERWLGRPAFLLRPGIPSSAP